MQVYGSQRFWLAHRYVVRWWTPWRRYGPFFWYFRSRAAAIAAAEQLRGDYEVARLPDNAVIAFAMQGGRDRCAR